MTVLHNPITTEPEYSDEESALFKAMERYMEQNRRRFPSLREILEVLKSLGWRRVAMPVELPRFVVRPSRRHNI